MTTSVAERIFSYAPPRIPFLAAYPPGHELAGMHIERGRECGCGRWFAQHVVAQAFIEALPESRQAAFLDKCCEVTSRHEPEEWLAWLWLGSPAWFPKRCHRCLQRANETAAALNA